MHAHGATLLVAYLAALVVLAWPVGAWLSRLIDGRVPTPLRAIERALLDASGVPVDQGMRWPMYSLALLAFNALGALVVYGVQRLQSVLPLNPQGFAAPTPDLAFNTAVSFVTNTNWQAYSGESTMSHLTQMLALAVQNFFSAATGIAVAFAFVRGFVRRSVDDIGNAWLDLTRVTLWLLLPLSFVLALAFVQQGVVQNFDAFKPATLIESLDFTQPKNGPDGQPLKDAAGQPITEPARTDRQTLPMGPVASQEAIKMLGTNGGGVFNANSAHPYENPTALTNFLQMLAIFVIPAGLCFAFGRVVGDVRQGWAIFAAMLVIFVAMAIVAMQLEPTANPRLAGLGVDLTAGNLEGKETRFGVDASALFATITTAASCGAVDAMHDSFMPLAGLVPLWLIQLGEVVFGGVGSGLYGMLVYALQAVFIAGLMIGRTPEYLGKKIESYEMKMVSIAILITPMLVLVGSALAVMVEPGRAGVSNPGAHGFSQVLYAFSSAANNNGSAFAGLSANTPFYNVALAVAMWFGRFGVIVPVLAIAGSLAAKKRLEVTSGTLPTHGPLFVVMLIGTVLLVGALTYVPALALGPVIEHLQLFSVR